jgi:hypothetical protein
MHANLVSQSDINCGRFFQQTPRISAKTPHGSVWFFLVSLVVATLFLPPPTDAQTLYGTLIGNVTDSTGSAVVGATVVATNAGTSVAKTATTDSSGTFRLSNMDVGNYKVSIAANSFASSVVQRIEIQANTEQRLDVHLQPGTVGQTVMVTAAPPELQTDTATVTSELETTEVRTLVTTAGYNMRNFQSLFQVLPGFSPPGEQHSEAGNPADTMMFNANGVSGSNNSTRVDGVSDIYAWLPEITAYTPSTEAIGSINVATNSMNAEQGFASGAAVNVTTKSGTNKFHGSAWEYNMISKLMAKPYFTPKTSALPKYVLNQFGANLGGPILKNKAFFFGNFESTRRSQASSGNQTVPSAAMIAGNFTGVTTNGTTPVTIYDPATGNADGTGRTQIQCNGQSNVICPDRISHAASQMIALLEANNNADLPNVPTANVLSASGIGNDFYGSADSIYTRNNVDARVDFDLSSKSTLFGRYGIQDTNIFARRPWARPVAAPSP